MPPTGWGVTIHISTGQSRNLHGIVNVYSDVQPRLESPQHCEEMDSTSVRLRLWTTRLASPRISKTRLARCTTLREHRVIFISRRSDGQQLRPVRKSASDAIASATCATESLLTPGRYNWPVSKQIGSAVGGFGCTEIASFRPGWNAPELLEAASKRGRTFRARQIGRATRSGAVKNPTRGRKNCPRDRHSCGHAGKMQACLLRLKRVCGTVGAARHC